MKVAIIGSAGIPSKYGGFETLVDKLVGNLEDKFEFHVYCSKKIYTKEERVSHYKGAKLHYVPINANGISSVLYDIVSMIHALLYADQLLVLGVSGGLFIPIIKLFTNKIVIAHIDGLEWRRGKWNWFAKGFLKLSERVAVKFSDADITDNEVLKKYTAINYSTLSTIIAYGSDHAVDVLPTYKNFEEYPFLQKKYAFSVCRIEPENNIHLILGAFYRSEMPLVFVGNWKNSKYGRDLVRKYAKTEHIILLNPIYDEHKINMLRSNATLYLHGHSAGGTNPSLVEAMNLGLPVLAYNVSYNKATTKNAAYYFSSSSELIRLVEGYNAEYKRMGKGLKVIAEEYYTWKSISYQYQQLFLSFEYNYEKKGLDSIYSQLPLSILEANNLVHLRSPKKFYA